MFRCIRLLLILLCHSFISQLPAEEQTITPSHPLFTSAHWGILVVDADSKEEVYSHQSSKLFIPASLTKLFTSALVLEAFEPNECFYTTVKSAQMPDSNGTIQGNLWLIGGGDPFLSFEELVLLAKELHQKGVRNIEGVVIADDSLFKGISLPIHGEWEDLAMDYSSEISALTVNYNVVNISVKPHPEGMGAAVVTLKQEIPYSTLIAHVETVPATEVRELQISRGFSNNIIEIEGKIPANSPEAVLKVAVHNPTEYARQLFVKALRDEGIQVKGGDYQTTEPLIVLAKLPSKPVSDALLKQNKESHNLTAELLHKLVGVREDPKVLPDVGAQQALKKMMGKIAISSNDYRLYDGAGLSRHNLVSPEQVVKLLAYVNQAKYKDVFINTLPITGVDGTLVKRFQDKPEGLFLQAKTGSMSGLVNLAGFAKTPSGRSLIFCMMINTSVLSNKETEEVLGNFLLQIMK